MCCKPWLADPAPLLDGERNRQRQARAVTAYLRRTSAARRVRHSSMRICSSLLGAAFCNFRAIQGDQEMRHTSTNDRTNRIDEMDNRRHGSN